MAKKAPPTKTSPKKAPARRKRSGFSMEGVPRVPTGEDLSGLEALLWASAVGDIKESDRARMAEMALAGESLRGVGRGRRKPELVPYGLDGPGREADPPPIPLAGGRVGEFGVDPPDDSSPELSSRLADMLAESLEGYDPEEAMPPWPKADPRFAEVEGKGLMGGAARLTAGPTAFSPPGFGMGLDGTELPKGSFVEGLTGGTGRVRFGPSAKSAAAAAQAAPDAVPSMMGRIGTGVGVGAGVLGALGLVAQLSGAGSGSEAVSPDMSGMPDIGGTRSRELLDMEHMLQQERMMRPNWRTKIEDSGLRSVIEAEADRLREASVVARPSFRQLMAERGVY